MEGEVRQTSQEKHIISGAESIGGGCIYLAKEVAAGRVVALSAEHQLTDVHLSRFRIITKPHQPGKWRLIVDMSHPKGRSINDGISPELCFLAYASLYDAVKIIL